jgi:hypothetical protein
MRYEPSSRCPRLLNAQPGSGYDMLKRLLAGDAESDPRRPGQAGEGRPGGGDPQGGRAAARRTRLLTPARRSCDIGGSTWSPAAPWATTPCSGAFFLARPVPISSGPMRWLRRGPRNSKSSKRRSTGPRAAPATAGPRWRGTPFQRYAARMGRLGRQADRVALRRYLSGRRQVGPSVVTIAPPNGPVRSSGATKADISVRTVARYIFEAFALSPRNRDSPTRLRNVDSLCDPAYGVDTSEVTR